MRVDQFRHSRGGRQLSRPGGGRGSVGGRIQHGLCAVSSLNEGHPITVPLSFPATLEEPVCDLMTGRPSVGPQWSSPLSSRGLGRRPLTAETRVRIPVAVSTICLQAGHFWADLVANRWPICGWRGSWPPQPGPTWPSVRRLPPPAASADRPKASEHGARSTPTLGPSRRWPVTRSEAWTASAPVALRR